VVVVVVAERDCEDGGAHCTGAVLAMKPEATTIGRSAKWPLENNLNVRWAYHTEIFRSSALQQTTRQ